MKHSYAVVFERVPSNYGAYCPDVPGCVATGGDWAEVQQMMRGALEFHFEGMREDDEPIPEPTMGIEDAMQYHCAQVSEEPVSGWAFEPTVEVTVAMLEVEVPAVEAAAVEVVD